MITLRSDGDDDQPRDENGQWSSSGGGGLSTPKSPEETKKLKSKIKEAQANVKLAEMIGPGATERAKAKLADLEKPWRHFSKLTSFTRHVLAKVMRARGGAV